MNNMLEQEELSEIIAALTKSTWRGAGQSGRTNGLVPLIGKDTVLQLWQDGYRDWQISQIMNVKLSVIQDCLINNSIDYKSRSLPIDKKLYQLSSTTTLFDGAAYLMLHMYLYDLTLADLCNRMHGITPPYTLQRITEGRLIPTLQQVHSIADVLHININIWMQHSKDIRLIIKENKELLHSGDDYASTCDDFFITYKKFNVRYIFAYARVLRLQTTDKELALALRITEQQLTDIEQCEYTPTLQQAEILVNMLGLTDVSDVYRCAVLPAGYRAMMKHSIENEYAKVDKTDYGKWTRTQIQNLINSRSLDALAAVERGCTYAKKTEDRLNRTAGNNAK